MSLGQQIANACMMRGLSLDGSVYIFFEDAAIQLILSSRGKHASGVRINNAAGDKYKESLETEIDNALSRSDTVGFATATITAFEHLKKQGTFKYERGEPVRYERGSRSYVIF